MLKPTAHWCVPKMLEALGTPSQIRAQCQQHQLAAPAAGSIRMWRHRRSIPTHWIPTMVVLLRAQDRELANFIRRPGTPF